jgi:hypothetical protein
MGLPPAFVRGGMWCADMRSHGGGRRVSLGLPASAPPLEVGAALQRKLDDLRLGAKLTQPDLPGLDDPELCLSAVIEKYLEDREGDFGTDAGGQYVRDYCRRVAGELGHMRVAELTGQAGRTVVKEWRKRLWDRGLSNLTVHNYLHALRAILVWGADDRELCGPLPKWPKGGGARPGQTLRSPVFETWPEADFLHLRGHLFDECLRWGGLNKLCGSADAVAEYIARRQAWLSLAFYTGLHPFDLNRWRGDWLYLDAGRYERHNHKSASSVDPAPFDMPEQLRLDLCALLDHLGKSRFGESEIVTCGHWPAWGEWSRTIAKAVPRLFPQGGRCRFTSQVARRSTIWEYTIRGWRTHEIAAIVGHVDTQMIDRIYRRCDALGLVSPVRVAWTVASGPGGRPTRTGKVIPFAAG